MGPRILDIRSVDSQVVSVLLDTSILIYYLEGVEPYYPLTEEIFNDIADEFRQQCCWTLPFLYIILKELNHIIP